MICPKCGFSQPDDYYCASCGVNVEKYVEKRKKKRYKAGTIVAVIGIAAVSIAVFMSTKKDTEKFEISSKDKTTKDKVSVKRTPRERSRKPDLGSRNVRSPESARRPVSRPPTQPLTSAQPEEQRSPIRETGARPSPGEPSQKTESQSQPDKSDLTARTWFEKGVSLDDDSDNEMEFYQKAIELDAKFAPAYYRLGAIYFRQANYDLAELHFARFLQYASDTDRQAYDVSVYFSLEDLERLLEEESKEAAPPEEEKETAAAPEEAAVAEAGEEAAPEETEEVEAIINFSASNGHMVVPVLFNGSTNARMLFDTGAEITVLSRELAQSLGLVAEAGRAINLKTVAADVRAQVATLDSITVGDLSRTDFRVALVDFNLDQQGQFEGILGMDFLRNYSIRIDNAANRILLTPSKTKTK